jgi:hypothetical protein
MICRALFFFCITLSLAVPSPAQRPGRNQDLPITSQAPIQVELLASLDAGKLSPGASVFAKARVDWNQPTCHLRAGSMVVGHIVNLEKRTKQKPGSSLTIAFDHADCDGHMTPVSLTLFALIAVPHVDEGIPLADSGARFGAASTNPHMGMGGASIGSAPPPVNMKDDMSVSNQTSEDKTPKVIQAGQVIGLKKVTLSVGRRAARPPAPTAPLCSPLSTPTSGSRAQLSLSSCRSLPSFLIRSQLSRQNQIHLP